MPSTRSPRASSRHSAGSGARRSSRRRRRSSFSCAAGASSRWRWSLRRSTEWPPVASTTSSAEASIATPWTIAGSSRTSRRCSTTTPSSPRPTCTRGSSPGASAIARSSRRRSATCSASSRLPDGGFASAHDADTDGVEGLTYTWTPDEADGRRAPARAARAVRARPLRRSAASSSRSFGGASSPSATRARSRSATTRRSPRGTASRSRRSPRPATGSSAPTGWMRLGGSVSSSSARSPPTTDACYRSIRDGRTSGFGFLDDYANVAHGLLELHVATGELRWLLEARRLALLAVELFADDEHGGFFLSPADGDARVARTKDLQDTPIPSGNSMLAYVLLRLSRIWGDDELERRAVSVFRLVEPALRARARLLRVDALRDRPLAQPSARDRDRRRRRLARRAGRARAVPAANGRRGRPVGGGAAARRQAARRRSSLRSTSASASPAAPRSPNRRSLPS